MAKPETGVLSARVPLEFFNRVAEFVKKWDNEPGGRSRFMIKALDSYMGPSDSMEFSVIVAERDLLKDELDRIRIGAKSPQIERIPASKKAKPLAPLSQHTKARMQVLRQFDRRCSGWTTSELANATGQHTPNVSKRVQELASEGFLTPSGSYRKSRDSGKMLMIWKRTAKLYTGDMTCVK